MLQGQCTDDGLILRHSHDKRVGILFDSSDPDLSPRALCSSQTCRHKGTTACSDDEDGPAHVLARQT